jgi:hypothetical protein
MLSLKTSADENESVNFKNKLSDSVGEIKQVVEDILKIEAALAKNVNPNLKFTPEGLDAMKSYLEKYDPNHPLLEKDKSNDESK